MDKENMDKKKRIVRLELDTVMWSYIKLVASLKGITVGEVIGQLIKHRMDTEKDVTVNVDCGKEEGND